MMLKHLVKQLLSELMGKLEHASAFIHTLKFGNKFRDAVEAKSILPFTNKRGGAGTAVAHSYGSQK